MMRSAGKNWRLVTFTMSPTLTFIHLTACQLPSRNTEKCSKGIILYVHPESSSVTRST